MPGNDFITVDVQGIQNLQEKLSKLGGLAAPQIAEDVAEYLKNVVQTEQPTPNMVSRKAAYGQTFQSDKQRRWFFAALADGSLQVPYKRTQGMRNAWRVIGKGGLNPMLVNETEAAYWTMGEVQARQPAMVGWKKLDDIVKSRMYQIKGVANAAVKKVIRILGL